MPRWALILLLVAAVICAGIGVGLTNLFAPLGAHTFGWTAYAPLSRTVYTGSFTPIDPIRLIWAPRIGIALLGLGAGTAGAVLAALLTEARRRSTTAPADSD